PDELVITWKATGISTLPDFSARVARLRAERAIRALTAAIWLSDGFEVPQARVVGWGTSSPSDEVEHWVRPNATTGRSTTEGRAITRSPRESRVELRPRVGDLPPAGSIARGRSARTGPTVARRSGGARRSDWNSADPPPVHRRSGGSGDRSRCRGS